MLGIGWLSCHGVLTQQNLYLVPLGPSRCLVGWLGPEITVTQESRRMLCSESTLVSGARTICAAKDPCFVVTLGLACLLMPQLRLPWTCQISALLKSQPECYSFLPKRKYDHCLKCKSHHFKKFKTWHKVASF
jgi:hypothetical protein